MSAIPADLPMPALLPAEAEITGRIQESPTIFTLHLRLCDDAARQAYRFRPGQFNMLYLYGVGEVPISISSDPEDRETLGHTIRAVGRVTRALSTLGPGDRIGVRGPFGRGWPLVDAEGRDLVLVTGGLGCAPTVAVIHYCMRRRDRFGRINILQGVKHSEDLIWRRQYREWAQVADTRVLLAADVAGPDWPGIQGPVTLLFDRARFDPARTTAMMCGPQPMMVAAARELLERGADPAHVWLSTERNMQCAAGHCGHCQLGPWFVCRDGPVFSWAEIGPWLVRRGF